MCGDEEAWGLNIKGDMRELSETEAGHGTSMNVDLGCGTGVDKMNCCFCVCFGGLGASLMLIFFT